MICEVFLAIALSTVLAAMVSMPGSLSSWPILSCSSSLSHLYGFFQLGLPFLLFKQVGIRTLIEHLRGICQ